ncbi:MAG TPA: ABC transporter substrate-binding protein [Burkholderiales bacterium]|nr:ABC transporter substrate-binding protein [Burkholderiales bacterium]
MQRTLRIAALAATWVGIAFVTAMILAPFARAVPPAPDALVRRITDDVLATLRENPAIQAGDARQLGELVRTKILPHFDFARATAIAVGPRWRSATPEQRAALTREFQTLLVRTYSSALASYRDQTIVTLPAHMNPADTDVTVHSQIRQSGAAPIGIDYAMAREGDDWKVFDIAVDGISLVQNYRESFRQTLDQRGVDGLISELAAKNAGH